MSSSGQPEEPGGEILSHDRWGQDALQGEVVSRALPAQLEAARSLHAVGGGERPRNVESGGPAELSGRRGQGLEPKCRE